ncbi:MAG TPA: fenitrothion hydrolase, partial [Solirubrobacteraceae bacterium]
WVGRRTGTSGLVGEPLPYPGWLGRWPAVVGIFGFAWLELVFINRDDPSTLALLTAAYALVQLVGMAFFGIERWSERGDAFAVTFNLFAHLAPFEYHDGTVYWRRPLSGLTSIETMPGTAPLLCTMIGTTTFDGASNGPVWRSVAPSIVRDFQRLGLSGPASLELTGALGIAFCVLLVATVYWLGIRGMQSVSGAHATHELGTRFIHTIVPIAFGYLLAHYFSLLVTQGQATASFISDPLGTGSNLFGTANVQIDWGLISAAVIWYVQVAALVSGHVSGLVAAHDRALVVYGDVEEAAESQRWMLLVMVTFTCFGLWLLSAVNT